MSDTPDAQALLDVARAAGARTSLTTYDDDKPARLSVMSFPDLALFAAAVEDAGLTASYSAGSGWSFAVAERSEGSPVSPWERVKP